MITHEPNMLSQLHGDIVCEQVAGKSALTRIYSQSPLKLIATDPVGTAPHVVMSSFGGGMVMGDEVAIRLDIQPEAQCVLTTQASSKIYRSTGKICKQSIDASIGNGALLAVLPDPLCCFEDSRFSQGQTYRISERGNLVWLDWITSGRWARDERWKFDSYESVADIWIENKLVIRETLSLDGDIGASFRMGHYNCYAVLVMVGTETIQLIQEIDADLKDQPFSRLPGYLVSLTKIDNGAVIRMLGADAQSIQDKLRPMISKLTSVIGGDPWARKW